MVTRCLENRVFSVTANRIGSEARGGKERLTFIGKRIVDPAGPHSSSGFPRSGRIDLAIDIDPAEARTKGSIPTTICCRTAGRPSYGP